MISELCALGLSDDELSRWHDDDLAPARMALIRTHTATCAACRERLAAFEKIGAGLRNLQPPPLDIARLIASLHEAAPTTTATPEPTLARLTTRKPHRSRRMMTGAAGLAAVLLLSLLAGYIFATYGPLRPAGNTRPGAPLLISIDEMPMEANVISMSSRSDGWAFGSKANDGSKSVIALHYTAGKWTRVQTGVKGRINALKMLSANDGWLTGSNVYHYDGHSWREVTVPRQSAYDDFGQIAVISPAAIWITVDQGSKPAILHYDGAAWNRQDLPTPDALHLGYYSITGIAMASADEGWAIGSTFYSPTNNPAMNDMRPLGVLLHYTGGAWKLEKTYPSYELTTISIASATNGWIGGDYWTDFKQYGGGSSSAISRPFLWRLTDGVWQNAPLPGSQNGGSLVGIVWSIQMLSATESWMIAGISPAAQNPPSQSGLPQVSFSFIPMYHWQNGQWVEVPISSTPSPYNADHFAFISPDEFWTIGGWGISHYYKGEWKNVVA